jgi:DNA polymerase-4/protein ImuB
LNSPDYAIDSMEVELATAIMAAAERASKLPVRMGMADGKFASYVAAFAANRGRRPHPNPLPEGEGVSPGPWPPTPDPAIIPPGESASFLADLSIEDLPVSTEMKRRLRLFGMRTLGELARLPQSAVLAQFGSEGGRAWQLAHGIDREPIIPYVPPRSVTERLAFTAPVDTFDALLAAVRTLLGRALHRPTTQGRAARALRMRLHLEDGHTWERQAVFREPVGNSERMILALRLKIDSAELPAPFTEVEVTLLGLCGESALQLNLFTSERGRQLARVAEAARQLKSRYGRPILSRVIEVEPWSRIPERRFALIDYDP